VVAGLWVWALAAAGLVSTSEVLIGVHLWALTEPLYLILGLAALLLMGAYLAPHARGVFLVLAGLASASALLRRYAGAATVIAGACALGLLQGQERGRKRGDLLRLPPHREDGDLHSHIPQPGHRGAAHGLPGGPGPDARAAPHGLRRPCSGRPLGAFLRGGFRAGGRPPSGGRVLRRHCLPAAGRSTGEMADRMPRMRIPGRPERLRHAVDDACGKQTVGDGRAARPRMPAGESRGWGLGGVRRCCQPGYLGVDAAC